MKQLLLILSLIFTVISCKKEEESCGTCPVGGSVEPPPGFTFSKNGGATIEADSAFFFPSTSTVLAYYQGMTNRIIIKTSAQAVGTYSFNGASNRVTYIEPLGSYNANNGSINITENVNGKLSGNFISGGTGVASSINGQFKDVPQR